MSRRSSCNSACRAGASRDLIRHVLASSSTLHDCSGFELSEPQMSVVSSKMVRESARDARRSSSSISPYVIPPDRSRSVCIKAFKISFANPPIPIVSAASDSSLKSSEPFPSLSNCLKTPSSAAEPCSSEAGPMEYLKNSMIETAPAQREHQAKGQQDERSATDVL